MFVVVLVLSVFLSSETTKQRIRCASFLLYPQERYSHCLWPDEFSIWGGRLGPTVINVERIASCLVVDCGPKRPNQAMLGRISEKYLLRNFQQKMYRSLHRRRRRNAVSRWKIGLQLLPIQRQMTFKIWTRKFKVSKRQPSYRILGYSSQKTPELYHVSWIFIVQFKTR